MTSTPLPIQHPILLPPNHQYIHTATKKNQNHQTKPANPNPTANLSELPRPLHYPPHHDALPSFPSLKSEDERELKATYHKPGTFTVNAIPSSFRSLPEYSDYDTEDQPQAPAPLTKTTSATAKSEGGSSSTTGRKGRGRSASGRKASAGAGGAGKGYGGNETSVVLERFENPSDKASLPLSASSASSSQQGGITSPYARLTDRLADPYAYDPQHYPSASHHPPSHQQYAVYASTSLPRPNLSALTTDQHQQQHHPHLPTHPHQPLAPMTLTSPTTTSPYHYQSGSFAPPPHPPQYPAPYQYAQAGMAPPYPQHPPRAYPAGPPPPLHYGGSAQYTTHDYGQHATSPTAHPAAVQQYGYEQLPRAEAMPRYSQVHPPPAPSPYETPRGVGIGGGGGAVMQLPLLGGRGPAQQGVLDQYPMGPGGVGAHGGQHGYGRYYSSGGAGGSEAHGYYEGEGE